MMTWLRKHNKEILLVTFGTFVLGGVVFTGAQGFATTSFSPVLIVNGQKIPYKRYETLLTRRLQQEEGASTPEAAKAAKAAVLRDLVQEAAFLQEADRYGIVVTDEEVASVLQNMESFQRDGRFDQGLYIGYVTQGMRTTPSAFEEEIRRNVRRQKLLMLLSSAVLVSDGEARDSLRFFPDKDRKKLSSDLQALRTAVVRRQGEAAVQEWWKDTSTRLKVESRLNRWEKDEGN
jgi:peptidyl-prolyl cis-trans isomerase D